MNDLTIIVPIYKTEKYIKKNIEMWKKASKVFDVYFVQDSLTGDAKKLADECGAFFLKKENGNWGSVINYVKHNSIIKTKYTKIVDADDKIYVDKILNILKTNVDDEVIVGNVKFSYKKRTETRRYLDYIDNVPFIHSLIFKTSIFLKTIDLPENTSFMDSLLVYELYENSKTFLKIDETIYDYSAELPGQSSDKKLRNENKLWDAFKMILDIYIEKANKKAVKGNLLIILEQVIWRTKDNKKYKDAYKVFWRESSRGYFTKYPFMLIRGIFKKKVL